MSRATEKKIAAALKQWSKLRSRKERIEAERDQTIAPIRARFEQRCAPFIEKARLKCEPIQQEMTQLEAEITEAMKSGISANGDIKFSRVSCATAVAEVVTRTERELDAKTFFESIPVSERSEAFWSCLKTLVGKAEKFLGADRLNVLAHAKRNHSVSITAK